MSAVHVIPRPVEPEPAHAPPITDPMPIAAAFERVRAAIEAVPDAALEPINVDIPHVVFTVRVALPGLLALRPAIARDLPRFDLATLDALADTADALAFLHTEWQRSETPVVRLPALYDEALEARAVVLAVGRSLARLGRLEAHTFERAGRVTGYANVAYELIGLCSTLIERLPELGGRCPLTATQLERGQALAHSILDALAERSRGAHTPHPAKRNRQRAYTLLVTTWAEVRRAVVYLRWAEGDADELMPSFSNARGRGRPGRRTKHGRRRKAVGGTDDEAGAGAWGASDAARERALRAAPP